MNKIITTIAAIVCAATTFAAASPKEEMDAAKKVYNAAKAAYEHVSTNSTSKAEIEKAKETMKTSEKAYETAQEEYNLLAKWNLGEFTFSDLNATAWDRYDRGKKLQISRWFTSRDEAFNIAVIKGIKAETNTVKKCEMTMQVLEDM